MVFTCNNCHFIFNSKQQPEQCPDCGKYTVRLATEEEEKELEERKRSREI